MIREMSSSEYLPIDKKIANFQYTLNFELTSRFSWFWLNNVNSNFVHQSLLQDSLQKSHLRANFSRIRIQIIHFSQNWIPKFLKKNFNGKVGIMILRKNT